MSIQDRETLPVAISDLERRKDIYEEILQNIAESLDDPEGMLDENKRELMVHHETTRRQIGELAANIARWQQLV